MTQIVTTITILARTQIIMATQFRWIEGCLRINIKEKELFLWKDFSRTDWVYQVIMGLIQKMSLQAHLIVMMTVIDEIIEVKQ